MDKSSYLAIFTSRDGRTSRALFSKNGYMNYAINFGDEKSLPKEERRILKSNFVDFTIGRVSEVTAEGQKIWIVNLEDDDNYIIVRIADKSVDELVHYHTLFLTDKKGKVIIP